VSAIADENTAPGRSGTTAKSIEQQEREFQQRHQRRMEAADRERLARINAERDLARFKAAEEARRRWEADADARQQAMRQARPRAQQFLLKVDHEPLWSLWKRGRCGRMSAFQAHDDVWWLKTRRYNRRVSQLRDGFNRPVFLSVIGIRRDRP
jgi:hypothetical protein